MNYGGEGSSLFTVTREGGRHEDGPVTYKGPWDMGPAADRAEMVKVPGVPASSDGPDDDDTHHLENWLQAMRDRKQPNATVDDGFSHSIACMMANQAYWSGKRVYWEPQKEEMTETLPTAA